VILDFDRVSDDTELDADVCIVGAGAAGITLALEFLWTGLEVLVVESGGERYEDAGHDLCETDKSRTLIRVHWSRALTLRGGGAMQLPPDSARPADAESMRAGAVVRPQRGTQTSCV
jgi:2-polyprenyl-6-methoxyphenol hydroxylase-like FAD-dependent oxidoreductase